MKAFPAFKARYTGEYKERLHTNTPFGFYADGWLDATATLEDDRERLQARTDMLEFSLTQARIVLDHFRTMLTDPDHRRIAEGALIASAPPESEREIAAAAQSGLAARQAEREREG